MHCGPIRGFKPKSLSLRANRVGYARPSACRVSGMTFITNRVSIPLPVGKPNQTKTRQGAASLQRILVAVVTCVVGMVLACVIAAAVFHDSSRAHQDLQDRAVLSLDLVSLPLGDAVSCQDKNLVNRLLSGLATNDDFVCATIFGLDEKVVDHASTKLEQRIPTA